MSTTAYNTTLLIKPPLRIWSSSMILTLRRRSLIILYISIYWWGR
jgi:hypothetical protein